VSNRDIAEQTLRKALDVVTGARRQSYGNPEDNFKNISVLWDAWRSIRGDSMPPAAEVAIQMILMKIARLSESPAHEDSWIDIAGYAACGARAAGVK
jgi:hypothetical protein